MSDDGVDPRFRDAPEACRFELQVGEHVAFIDYKLVEGGLALVHTKTPPELEGQGIGSRLVRSALLTARKEDVRIRPDCPFVAAYIERHPEFADLTIP